VRSSPTSSETVQEEDKQNLELLDLSKQDPRPHHTTPHRLPVDAGVSDLVELVQPRHEAVGAVRDARRREAIALTAGARICAQR
jgi:hypothetical protein